MRILLALFLTLPLAAADKLNVVLIMADDVGYECFGFSGSKQYKTPHLDRLADSGVRFSNAFSTPLCTPSRVALMTGRNSIRNYVDFGALDPGETTFVEMFRKAGYATAISGKWQLQGSEHAKGVGPGGAGFDEYCLWNTPFTKRPRYWNPSQYVNGKVRQAKEDDYGPDVAADFLIDFMERNKERPFFAYYPMMLVHSPFLPTPDSTDRNSKDEQKNFADMVAYMDKIVGRLAGSIDRLGLREKTVLIFTADNGTHVRLRSRLNGRTIQGGKGTPTDRGTHVPLIVYAPGTAQGGRVVDDLIAHSDFVPTLAQAAGLEFSAPAKLDGRSFWPQVLGQPGDPRETQFTYYFPRPYSTTTDGGYRSPEVRFVRDKRYRLLSDGRLYDLHSDPSETTPLASGRADDVRGKLQGVLDAWPRHGERIPQAEE